MKKIKMMISLLVAMASANAFAWSGSGHDSIAQAALDYMGSSYATSDMQRAYNVYVGSAGGNVATAKSWLGTYAKDVDQEKDLSLGGWWVGGCHSGSDWFLGIVDSKYTKMYHAIAIDRYGQGVLGNSYPGYKYRWARSQGVTGLDRLLAGWLWNQHMCSSTKKGTYTEYHFGSGNVNNSDTGDYQDIEFQPIDSLVRAWFNRSKAGATFKNIGGQCHGADATVVGHYISTWDQPHPDYESHCKDRASALGLYNNSTVDGVVDNYTTTMRADQIVTLAGEWGYFSTSGVLSTNNSQVWDDACEVAVPHSVAACVALYTKSVNCLYGEDCNN